MCKSRSFLKSLIVAGLVAAVAPNLFAQNYRFEFSVDIGSDKELSDPFADGDEAFDPGDVYWWQSAPVVPPGRDGFKDDMSIFGMDPWPDPPDPGLVTAVPVGAGSIQDFFEYFDLDGHDQIDFNLQQIDFPYPRVPSNCIFPPQFLMISYDDDKAASWPLFDVPVTAPSPAGVSSYGSTAGRDEIIGINLIIMPVPPYPFAGMYPIADERTVHASLSPNPDGIEEEDDDVDSLDIVESEDVCPFWYFSADHEAHFGLDPGGIYLVTGGGPVQVIDEAFHLGIPEETDIDAFEFTWLENPQQPDGTMYLALLYSVDDNDPFTPIDESGGMMPNVIYASFMTGFSFPLTNPLQDDIDAITIWRQPIEEPPPTGACCLQNCGCVVMTEVDCVNNGGVWGGAGTDCTDADGNGVADVCETCGGDVNCDGFVNLGDLAQLLANYGTLVGATWQMGDIDGDGDVDLADLALLLASYGSPCP